MGQRRAYLPSGLGGSRVAGRISARRLADLLAGHGHLGELRARVSNGDGYAGSRLADLLSEPAS